MKKIINSILVVAAAAIALTACTKEEPQVSNESGVVTFHALSPATKTTFGTLAEGKYPTIWTANDSEVKIAQNYKTGVDAAVTKKSDTEATFDAKLTADGSGSYTFYAVTPASAVVSGVNSSYKNWNLEIPDEQTPTASGPDEKAMLMAATSTTTDVFPSEVNLAFKHLTAYGKMSILNLGLAAGDEVSSVLISASNNLAYRYYYYVGGENSGKLLENTGKNAITIHTSSASDIWFACAPLAKGTKLTIAVTTANSKVYTKENIAIPAALDAGHIAVFNVDFDGITPPADKVYNLVTDYSEITAGSEVIIAAVGATAYAAGIATTSGNYVSHVAQSKSDSGTKIINPGATVGIYTIGKGTETSTISLSGENGYLSAKSGGNYMNANADLTDDGSWTVTIKNTTTGETLLKNIGTVKPYMRYNGSAYRFSCYDSEVDNVALYKLEGSGSGPSLITTYTVTYNGNGNTGGSAPASVVTSGLFTVAAAGDLEKTGYTFNGWNSAADGSGTSYSVGTNATVTADVTLYAQWIEEGGKTEYTITWNSTNNSKSVSSYTASWSVTADGLTCNMANWNNNNNSWAYVKCGRKGNASVATIITATAITEAISDVTLTIDAITAASVNSIKLYISDDGSTWTEEGSFTKAAGDQTVSVASPAANKYYKLEFDCASGSANGLVTVSKLVFTVDTP